MLSPIAKTIYRPPQSQNTLCFSFDGETCQIEIDEKTAWAGRVQSVEDQLKIEVLPQDSEEQPGLLLAVMLEALFSHLPVYHKAIIQRVVDLKNEPTWNAFFHPDADEITISRHELFQLPTAWHRKGRYEPSVENWTLTGERPHPQRPRLQTGVHYRRFIPTLGATISLRTVEVERDLEIFHQWHNQPRVADLWELNKPLDELHRYLEKGLADPHQIPMILEFDDRPVGYFEFYWVAEDRLAPYYESEPYDRGLHFLIGDPKFLGRQKTSAVLHSAMHCLFLDDARTRRILAEPRSDNKKVLKYVQLVPGWRFIKEFDFPHKRAALLMAKREDFFREGTL